MTPEMQKFIDLLESELGYSDQGGSYTKFGDWYGKNIEFDADYSAAPWCDMYLSWAAHKLGYQDWVGQFAWTVAHAEWFQEQDAWGAKPKPGAFVFYDWSGSGDVDEIDHVGIVTKVEGDTIFTIEGNIDGGVAKRKERDTSDVVGFGYPEKIKERLDAQARLKEAAKESYPSTGIRSVQPPLEAGLTALIPDSEPEAQGPVIVKATPTKSPSSSPVSPTPSASDASDASTASDAVASSASSASSASGAKVKGKHAKPATADTQSATTAPMPAIANVSAPSTLPSLSSPALVGTALVAALAVLAVAKTRQLRVRLAPSTGRRPALLKATPTAEFDAFAPTDVHSPAGRAPTSATDEAFDAMVAGVRESFDALEHDVLATYQGRRRRPANEASAPDTPMRGRRHRASDEAHGTGHRTPTRSHASEPGFTTDAPLRGRRHRATPEKPEPTRQHPETPEAVRRLPMEAEMPKRRKKGSGRHRA